MCCCLSAFTFSSPVTSPTHSLSLALSAHRKDTNKRQTNKVSIFFCFHYPPLPNTRHLISHFSPPKIPFGHTLRLSSYQITGLRNVPTPNLYPDWSRLSFLNLDPFFLSHFPTIRKCYERKEPSLCFSRLSFLCAHLKYNLCLVQNTGFRAHGNAGFHSHGSDRSGSFCFCKGVSQSASQGGDSCRRKGFLDRTTEHQKQKQQR